jgi:putative hydrolase of the HAD superfamily
VIIDALGEYMRVQHVIFDWAGTLTPWLTVDTLANWLAAARVLNPDQATDVAERLLASEKRLMVRSRDEHVSATVQQVFESAGITPTPAALDAYRQAWDCYTHTDAEAVGLLSALREHGLSIGVLSNTLWPANWHREIFERDGVAALIDAAVYSSEVPWTKPHPETFRAAMAALGATDPASCCFVGDRLFEDIYGAQDVGMRTVLVPHSAVPNDELGSNAGQPDAVVQRLSEVLDVLEAWNAVP